MIKCKNIFPLRSYFFKLNVVVVFMFTLIVTQRLLAILNVTLRWFAFSFLFKPDDGAVVVHCTVYQKKNSYQSQYTNHFSLNLARLKCTTSTTLTPNRESNILLNMNCYSVQIVEAYKSEELFTTMRPHVIACVCFVRYFVRCLQ